MPLLVLLAACVDGPPVSGDTQQDSANDSAVDTDSGIDSGETPTPGTADLTKGKPADNPDTYVYSQCHNHYHFSGYATYRLYTPAGDLAATGHKQAFCLMDFEDWNQGGRARYDCNVQGISVGWA